MYIMEIPNFHTLKTDQFLNVKLHDSCRHVWQITKQIFLTLNKHNSNCILHVKKKKNSKKVYNKREY